MRRVPYNGLFSASYYHNITIHSAVEIQKPKKKLILDYYSFALRYLWLLSCSLDSRLFLQRPLDILNYGKD